MYADNWFGIFNVTKTIFYVGLINSFCLKKVLILINGHWETRV